MQTLAQQQWEGYMARLCVFRGCTLTTWCGKGEDRWAATQRERESEEWTTQRKTWVLNTAHTLFLFRRKFLESLVTPLHYRRAGPSSRSREKQKAFIRLWTVRNVRAENGIRVVVVVFVCLGDSCCSMSGSQKLYGRDCNQCDPAGGQQVSLESELCGRGNTERDRDK